MLQGRFRSDVRKNFFTERVDRLSCGGVTISGVFKRHVNMALRDKVLGLARTG